MASTNSLGYCESIASVFSAISATEPKLVSIMAFTKIISINHIRNEVRFFFISLKNRFIFIPHFRNNVEIYLPMVALLYLHFQLCVKQVQ